MPVTEQSTERDSLLGEPKDHDMPGFEYEPSKRRAAAMITPRRQLLGDLLIKEGLITKAQLHDALRAQAERVTYAPVGQILVEQNVLTQEQLKHVLDKYHKAYRLGDILVETTTITEEQLGLALRNQKETGQRLGDVLVKLNFATEQQIKRALCKQLRIDFVDLDNVIIDRGLTELITRRYAQRHRVLPIAKIENRITVAMDDPTDTRVAEELEAFTGCKIVVATASAAAFERAFVRAYERAADPEPAPTPADRGGSGDERTRHEPDHAVTLADLRAECDSLRREREDALRALSTLKESHNETARALRELQETHDALQQERKATADTFRELAARTMTELQAARDALCDEREVGARALRDLEAGRTQTAQALAELQAAHAALRQEHDAAQQALREGRATAQALAELQAAHAALRQEHDAAQQAQREQLERDARPRTDTLEALETVVRRLRG